MGEKFDWAAYYRAAFEREKKKNTVLAGKIADAEAKEADLAFRLERIQGNALWKASAPVRKCYLRYADKGISDDRAGEYGYLHCRLRRRHIGRKSG